VLAKKGLDPDDGIEGLFDHIEGDDDGGISWDEFESFLVAGFTHESTAGGGGGSIRMSRTSVGGPGPRASTAWAASSGGGSSGAQTMPKSSITYIVEQCESEFHNIYKDCTKSIPIQSIWYQCGRRERSNFGVHRGPYNARNSTMSVDPAEEWRIPEPQ
jgi:hypothetical protein